MYTEVPCWNRERGTTLFRGVLISGGWNLERGVPEVSSFQTGGGFHIIRGE